MQQLERRVGSGISIFVTSYYNKPEISQKVAAVRWLKQKGQVPISWGTCLELKFGDDIVMLLMY